MPSGNGMSARAVTSVSITKRAAAASAAEQADGDPGRSAHRAGLRSARCLERDPQPQRRGSRRRAWPRRTPRPAPVPPVDHLVELQLHGREGRQRAAEAGAEERVAQALLRVVAEQGEEVAEQQGADHVDREGRPRPLPRRGAAPPPPARPGSAPRHAAGVDRRQAAKVESRHSHCAGLLSASMDVVGTVSGSNRAYEGASPIARYRIVTSARRCST